MFKVEEKIMQWIRNHLLQCAFVGITLLSFALRWALRDIESGDMMTCLLPWYGDMKGQGSQILSCQIGNYNLLYQFLIYLLTFIPIKPMYAYKLLSVVFDYVLAVGVGCLVSASSKKDGRYLFLVGYAVVLFCPTVFMNSICWGQCDAIYVAFIILALLACYKERYTWMFVLYGLAFAFKLQAVFALPFFLFLYFVKRKFSILQFLWIPGMILITSIPGLLHGRRIMDAFVVYVGQISNYDFLALSYPSFWCVICDANYRDELYDTFRLAAVLLTVAILLVMFVCWLYRKVELNAKNLLYILFLTSYTCVLFLPAMHERYGFLYEILAIAIVFYNRKTLLPCVGVIALATMMYGDYLFDLVLPINFVTALMNIGLYVCYMILLNRDLQIEA